MDVINLNKYIQNGLFLKNIVDKNLFDVVVYLGSENRFGRQTVESEISVEVFPGSRTCNDGDWKDLLKLEIEKYHKVLLILDDFVLSDIKNILDKVDVEKICVVNLWCGLVSYGKKNIEEIQDLHHIVDLGWKMAEPFDFISFFDLLASGESHQYIRITGLEVSGNLLGDGRNSLGLANYSFDQKGFSGGFATLLAMGSSISLALRVAAGMQELGQFVDVIASSDLGLQFDETLFTSISRTKKLIFFLDHKIDEALLAYYFTVLKEYKILDIELMFLAPDYTKLTTILSDFGYEQTGFDVGNMIEKLVPGDS